MCFVIIVVVGLCWCCMSISVQLKWRNFSESAAHTYTHIDRCLYQTKRPFKQHGTHTQIRANETNVPRLSMMENQ